MMLTLYAIPISLYCAKLRIVLRHKQLAWEEVPPPGGYGSDEYKALVPAGSLPALAHDGLLISDSETIAEYLDEAFPDPPMLPGTAQVARAQQADPAPVVQTVNINKADAPTLASALNGVGPSRAEKIVRYREAYGPFKSVEELAEVEGIGLSTLSKNRKVITLD